MFDKAPLLVLLCREELTLTMKTTTTTTTRATPFLSSSSLKEEEGRRRRKTTAFSSSSSSKKKPLSSTTHHRSTMERIIGMRRPLTRRRRPIMPSLAACATNTNDFFDGKNDFVEEEEDDRCLPFETYCEEKMMMLSERHHRTKAFDRLHTRGGVDPSVFLLCTFHTPHQGLIRTHRRTTIAKVAKISERWNWKILKRMESVEESLFALSKPPENVQPAIGFKKQLKRMRGRMEKTKRAQMWKAAEDAEWWGRGEDEEKDGGDGTTKDDDDDDAEEESSSSVFDASTKIACANIRAYFEYLGFQPTRAEWTSIQTLLGECLTSEKDRSMIRGEAIGGDADDDDDDERRIGNARENIAPPRGRGDARVSGGSSSFRLLKHLIEHKTKKPRRDGERRQLNRRYLLARENLVEAKKEWAIAEKSYKEARRKMSRARHEVAKTRKHVRSEFR